MQQYRLSNFSYVFGMNCIFVIDAPVKHLIIKSFLKSGAASAVTMTARKIIKKIKSNLRYAHFITLAVVP